MQDVHAELWEDSETSLKAWLQLSLNLRAKVVLLVSITWVRC